MEEKQACHEILGNIATHLQDWQAPSEDSVTSLSELYCGSNYGKMKRMKMNYFVVINFDAGFSGGLLFDYWFFVSGKHALVAKILSIIDLGWSIPSELLNKVKLKQQTLWYVAGT
jgi:hypothetical protein